MRLRLSPLLFLLLFTFAARGQESPIHNQTTPPADARFEIVQAQLGVKWTFRLDRVTGQVWQLVRTSTGGNAWQSVRVIDAPAASFSDHPHFQLFLSGLIAKHAFLIDTDSGRTWTFTTLINNGKETEMVWDPFEESAAIRGFELPIPPPAKGR